MRRAVHEAGKLVHDHCRRGGAGPIVLRPLPRDQIGEVEAEQARADIDQVLPVIEQPPHAAAIAVPLEARAGAVLGVPIPKELANAAHAALLRRHLKLAGNAAHQARILIAGQGPPAVTLDQPRVETVEERARGRAVSQCHQRGKAARLVPAQGTVCAAARLDQQLVALVFVDDQTNPGVAHDGFEERGDRAEQARFCRCQYARSLWCDPHPRRA